MNSHQRRLSRRKKAFNILKKTESFKIPKPNEKDFTVKQIKTLIKDFNLPNKQGIVFIQDNLKELIEDLKKRSTIYCELEPFLLKSNLTESKVYSLNIDNAVCKITELEYNENNNQLTGTIETFHSTAYPEYNSLIKDLEDGVVYFGIRAMGERIVSNRRKLVKIINIDVHFNERKLSN